MKKIAVILGILICLNLVSGACPCPEDVNKDGKVTILDVIALNRDKVDVNGDGIYDENDITYVRNRVGRFCSDKNILRVSDDGHVSLWNQPSPRFFNYSDIVKKSHGFVELHTRSFVLNPDSRNKVFVYVNDRFFREYENIFFTEMHDISVLPSEWMAIANRNKTDYKFDSILEMLYLDRQSIDPSSENLMLVAREDIGRGKLNRPIAVTYSTTRDKLFVLNSDNMIDVFSFLYDWEREVSITSLSNPVGMVWIDGSVYIADKGENKIVKLDDFLKVQDADFLGSSKKFDKVEDVGKSQNGNLLIFDEDKVLEYNLTDNKFINTYYYDGFLDEQHLLRRLSNKPPVEDLCFEDYFGINVHECDGTNNILWVSSEENSLASVSEDSVYNIPICYDGFICEARVKCELDEDVLLSLSSDKDAMVSIGDREDYPIKICCRQEKLGDAHWRNEEGRISESVVGEEVILAVGGEGVGDKEISFKIYKKDEGFFMDILKIITFGAVEDPLVGEFSSIGFYTWTPEESGNYYFLASLDGTNWISSEVLRVESAGYPKCVKGDNFAYWVISDSKSKDLTKSVNKNLCRGSADDGTDCCPNLNYECRNLDGDYICVHTGEEPDPCAGIEICSDYGTKEECNGDECGVGSIGCGKGKSKAVDVECGSITITSVTKGDCRCEWDDKEKKCVKKQEATTEVGKQPISFECVYSERYSGSCEEDGSAEVTREFVGLLYEELPEEEVTFGDLKSCESVLCETETKTYTVTCSSLSRLQLPFFSWFSLICVLGILGIFYFFKKKKL